MKANNPVSRHRALLVCAVGAALVVGLVVFGESAQQVPANQRKAGVKPAPRDAEQPSAHRYEGKTFAAWREELETEVKPARRIEAVRAMAAFARNGWGKEAAQAVFAVMIRY